VHELRTAAFDPEGTLRPRSPVETSIVDGADASCEAVLESFPGGIMVTGTVRAPWTGVCRRCAAALGGELEVHVRERFVDGAAPSTEVEDDPEAYPIDGDVLDLGPLVREALLLELPSTPLCRPDCRGLCPRCGVDRNVETCSCVAEADPRWAILNVLETGSGPDVAEDR
jgi:uncharacterized protein